MEIDELKQEGIKTFRILSDYHQNGKTFGDGVYELLKGVEEPQSLRQAAIQIEMLHRKSLEIHFDDAKERLGLALPGRTFGGRFGGRPQITPQARKLIKHYGCFQEAVETVIHKIHR